jgi:hypothetical protein
MRSSRSSSVWVMVGLGVTLSASPVAAQKSDSPSFLQQQRLIDEKLQSERLQQAPVPSVLDFQWGGWLEYYIFHFNDGVQKSRFSQRPGLALWTRLSADDGAHEFFARMKLRYTWFDPGDEYDRQEDWWGPNFDYVWYQIDFGKAFRLTKPSDPVQLQARIGQQQIRFGTGYTLDLPLDAALLDAKLYDFRVLGLVGNTIPSYPNIDRSEAVASHSNRWLYGVQLQYEGFQRHQPFAYLLWNDDKTKERTRDWLQNYSYDSFYTGLGSRGEVLHNLNYWAEAVFESGNGYNDGASLYRNYIEAWGWDAGLEYLFDLPTRPRLAVEYMFGSGDPGRHGSPTNARGGNRGDRLDRSFVGFGYRDTGLAAALTPSNLHVWKAGASFTPLEKSEFFRDLELGTNWFLYHKNQAHGAISDFTAGEFSGYVGWEMDYFLNCRLASDLSWTTRWGAFFPGDAFEDRDTRQFIMTGLTWSF